MVAAQVFDPEFRKQFPSVERYFTTLARQPQFAAVVGSDVQLCSEAPKRELRTPCTWRPLHFMLAKLTSACQKMDCACQDVSELNTRSRNGCNGCFSNTAAPAPAKKDEKKKDAAKAKVRALRGARCTCQYPLQPPSGMLPISDGVLQYALSLWVSESR
jgi:hypothetical protein